METAAEEGPGGTAAPGVEGEREVREEPTVLIMIELLLEVWAVLADTAAEGVMALLVALVE